MTSLFSAKKLGRLADQATRLKGRGFLIGAVCLVHRQGHEEVPQIYIRGIRGKGAPAAHNPGPVNLSRQERSGGCSGLAGIYNSFTGVIPGYLSPCHRNNVSFTTWPGLSRWLLKRCFCRVDRGNHYVRVGLSVPFPPVLHRIDMTRFSFTAPR